MNFSAMQFKQHLCKGQSVQCVYCLNAFQTTKSLVDHLECHKEHYNFHKCPDCTKVFPMLYLMECHKSQHRPIEKPHVCHVCSRAFRVKFLLKKHLFTHSEERRKYHSRINWIHFKEALFLQYLTFLCSFSSSPLRRMWYGIQDGIFWSTHVAWLIIIWFAVLKQNEIRPRIQNNALNKVFRMFVLFIHAIVPENKTCDVCEISMGKIMQNNTIGKRWKANSSNND